MCSPGKFHSLPGPPLFLVPKEWVLLGQGRDREDWTKGQDFIPGRYGRERPKRPRHSNHDFPQTWPLGPDHTVAFVVYQGPWGSSLIPTTSSRFFYSPHLSTPGSGTIIQALNSLPPSHLRAFTHAVPRAWGILPPIFPEVPLLTPQILEQASPPQGSPS